MASKCELVRSGQLRHKPAPADRIQLPDGRKMYTCWGRYDLMTESAMPECEHCDRWERGEYLR